MNNQDMGIALDMPANLFSNLGGKNFKLEPRIQPEENTIVKTNNELAEDMKEYYESGDIKLNKLSNQNKYRNRLNKMYESLKELKPIDNYIEDTIFTSNYIEKGIVIRPTISEMKQFWTEYRLMNNEKNSIIDKNYENPTKMYTSTVSSPSEFDELFDKLTKKVTEINTYINELKQMKEKVNNQVLEVQKKEEELELDRQQFLNYKQESEEEIRKEKETLRINFDKLQSIIDSLDMTLTEVE